MTNELDHPCRDTCSGWRQGYEKGRGTAQDHLDDMLRVQNAERALEAERARSAKLVEVIQYTLDLGYFSEASTAQWAMDVIAEYEYEETNRG